MRRRNRILVLQPSKRQAAFDRAMPKAKELKEKLRTARRRECLIPTNNRDGPCSPRLNNSHLIGESHLKAIARNGHVYEWDLTDISNIVTAWLMNGSTSISEPYNISVGRLRPSQINIKKCTRRLACTNHDGPVFEGIDAAKLDIESPDHQFLIGFRATTGTLALYESVLDLRHDFDYPEEIEFWKERGQWDQMAGNFDDRWTTTEKRKDEIKEWTGLWQKAYCDRDTRGDRIITSVKQFSPCIRVACSSVYRTEGKPQFTLTIIPSQDGTTATAIVSALKTTGFAARISNDFLVKRRLETICGEVVNLLETDPVTGVLHLAQRTHHFLINQDDYENVEIISDEGRERIETEMARAYSQPF